MQTVLTSCETCEL